MYTGGYTRSCVRSGNLLYCSFILMRTYLIEATNDSIVTLQLTLPSPKPFVPKTYLYANEKNVPLL